MRSHWGTHYGEELAKKQATVIALMPGEETDANFCNAFKKKDVDDLKTATAHLIGT